ncbi:Hypothetical protein POVR1_LOCUS545 [uncultured virus]|nr:Hypothetical protein POVR1_LOCUS545 [uncultured virus]
MFYFYTVIAGNTKVTEYFQVASRQAFRERLENCITGINFLDDLPKDAEYGITGLILGLCLNSQMDISTMPAIPLLISFYGDNSRIHRKEYLKTLSKKGYGMVINAEGHVYIFVPGSKRYMIVGNELRNEKDFIHNCTLGIGYCQGKLFCDRHTSLN